MPVSDPLLPLFLLHDEPINGHGENFFAPDPFATTIARAALGTKGPFTIGVYGDWGSGKTSALHAARDMIDRSGVWDHVVTVEFNAWRYEREAHPIVPLVATIEKALEQKLRERRKLKDQGKEFAATAFMFIWQVLVGFLAASKFKAEGEAGVPLVTKGQAGIEFDGETFVDRVEDAFETATVPKETPWTQIRDAAIYYSIFEQLSALHTAACKMGGEDLSQFPRIIVFIDDLDRCQADKAFELLENIKLVLAQPGFVFVLALNERVVRTYLDHLAITRYGEKNVALHKSYLDKIIQLPLHMPPRSGRFERFAQDLLDKRLAKAGGTETAADLKKLARILALSANRTPRSLVRRINTSLVDIALRDGEALPDSLKREHPPYPAFSGLCIVQRTLEAAVGADLTRDLALDHILCSLLHEKGIFGTLDALRAGIDAPPSEGESTRGAGGATTRKLKGAASGDGSPLVGELRNRIVQALYDVPFLYREDQGADGAEISGTSLLTSVDGQRWLSTRTERLAIMQITYQRPEEVVTPASATPDPTAAKPPSGPTTSADVTPVANLDPVVVEQRSLVERTIRQALKLPADALLSTADRARAIKLNFQSAPLTDLGLNIIMSPDTGVTALASLNLYDTNVTDDGLKALAHPDSGLKTLVSLNLSFTNVTDDGLHALARPDSGLKNLASLRLSGESVTDAGLKALARPDSGLRALAELFLYDTKVTDDGLRALARPDSGLKNLASLRLSGESVTDAGLKALARPDSGLRALAELFLYDTKVTDDGLRALARPDSGLKNLASLSLNQVKVTDDGLKALARPDSGLNALASLKLFGVKVTDDAVRDLQKARPKLRIER